MTNWVYVHVPNTTRGLQIGRIIEQTVLSRQQHEVLA